MICDVCGRESSGLFGQHICAECQDNIKDFPQNIVVNKRDIGEILALINDGELTT